MSTVNTRIWYSLYFLLGGLLFLLLILRPQQYVLLMLLLVTLFLLPFFHRFELRSLEAREVVPIAVLVAVAAVSRIPFALLPSIQPTTFVIMITAAVFGAETGFLVGALAAVVSNLFLGHGPWTLWQMLAWGSVGGAAGMLRHTWLMRTLSGRLIFGVLAGFLFGWIMNLSGVIILLGDFSWSAFFAYYAASFYFDLMHALGNVFFISLFSVSWMKVLHRYKRKYQILK
ncbi:ECF transporter S component [Marinicrinis sediminis]|uniref:ECF transporter S component n=1 Tax=Marinicrinis sediminis TaxID=1652465 RepID=A0ABW5R8H8_9BACL